MDAVDVVDELFVAQAAGGLRALRRALNAETDKSSSRHTGSPPKSPRRWLIIRVCLVRGWSSSFAKITAHFRS